MSVRLVNFRRRRHVRNGKYLIGDVCDVIADINHEVAGYAIVAWDDAGNTAFAASPGGPFANGAIPVHTQQVLDYAIAHEMKKDRDK